MCSLTCALRRPWHLNANIQIFIFKNYSPRTSLDFPVAQVVKNPPAIQQTSVQSLGWEVPLEKGMAIHSSILAWRIPWTEKPGGLQSLGSQSRTWLKTSLVVQWIRIHLPMCDTTVGPVCSKPHAPQQERPLQWEARARVAPAPCNLRKSSQSNEDPAQPQTNKYSCSRTLNIHWKDWCWSWNSNTLATWCEELTHWKRPWCWEWLKAKGEGVAEDEMVRWHHQLNGHEFEQTLGDSGG